MKLNFGRRYLPLWLALAGACVATPALAEYPQKTITWIVGYPAGGGSDFIARTVAAQISINTGQTIVIDNRPGASSNLAASAAVRAAPDGYTIFSADSGSLVYNKALFKRLSFDPDVDLAPISLIAKVPLVLVVSKDFPAKTAQEFVALAKASPGKINFASAGLGSPHHLAMESFKQRTGIDVTHVPYRGNAPAVTDLVAGTVGVMMLDLSSAQQFVKSGKLRALAILAPTRLKALPDVPSIAEAGIPNFDATAWQGVAVPKNVPLPIRMKLQAEIKKAVESPVVSQKLSEAGLIPMATTSDEFAKLISSDSKFWRDLITRTGITLD